MGDNDNLSFLEQRIEQRRREREKATREQVEKNPEFAADLVPDAVYEASDADQEIDRIIGDIDPLDAYWRWIGKMKPDSRHTQNEGVVISCPIPGHNDPPKGGGHQGYNAWINADTGLWFCGKCWEGGDVYDLAAIHMGKWNPGKEKSYKKGADFHLVREKMAKDYGYTITSTPGGQKIIVPPIIIPEEPEQHAEAPKLADVVQLHEDDDEEIEMPSFDWRPVVPEDTFLHEYMKAVCVDDAPEEYHFFHALIALGFALGRDATLFDSVPVYGNLFICTLGRSGVGKSKAKRHLDALLDQALPYDRSLVPSKGVKRVNAPGSAESLVYAFMEPVEDPSNPKRVAYYAPVKGIVAFNELSALVARTNRTGSAMKPTLMEFYDMEQRVETSSMTTGGKIAEAPFASAITTSQPLALRGLLDQTDDASGFLNRWVFVPGKEKRRYSVGGVQVDVTPAVAPLQRVVGWASGFGRDQIEWSDQAYAAWDKFFHDTLEPMRRKQQGHMLVRLDLTLKKLMLLFAANRHERELSEQSVADALYLFPYLKAAYGVPEAQIGNSVNNEIAEVIMKQIDKYKDGITMSKMWDNIKHRKFDRKRVLDMLTTLTKMGLIEEQAVNTGRVGRPTIRYRRAG